MVAGVSKDVSIEGRSAGGLATRVATTDFTSCDSGDTAEGNAWTFVADRLRDCCELPESMEDKLGDLRWPEPPRLARAVSSAIPSVGTWVDEALD